MRRHSGGGGRRVAPTASPRPPRFVGARTMFRRLFLSALTYIFLLGASVGLVKAQGFGPARPMPRRAADVVTHRQAEHAFRVMASQQDIAFGAIDDGCYARAH